MYLYCNTSGFYICLYIVFTFCKEFYIFARFHVTIYHPFTSTLASLSISYKAGPVVINSLSCSRSKEVFVSPSFLKDNLAGDGNLSRQLSSFSALNASTHTLLACKVSVEKYIDPLTGVPLCMMSHFSLDFSRFSLCLFITMCFW